MATPTTRQSPPDLVKGKTFTRDYPNCDYRPTLDSTHPQSKFWPAYLPVDPLRLVIFERSKNAQLVVYSANIDDTRSEGDMSFCPRDPITIQWQSFGWTDSSTTNAPGILERKLAWGYAAKKSIRRDGNVEPVCPRFEIQLVALASRRALLCVDDATGRPRVEMDIQGVRAALVKVFVSTSSSSSNDRSSFFARHLVPRVDYVEFYGTCLETGQDCIEKYIPS